MFGKFFLGVLFAMSIVFCVLLTDLCMHGSGKYVEGSLIWF